MIRGLFERLLKLFIYRIDLDFCLISVKLYYFNLHLSLSNDPLLLPQNWIVYLYNLNSLYKDFFTSQKLSHVT